jgi:hypothetical protein
LRDRWTLGWNSYFWIIKRIWNLVIQDLVAISSLPGQHKRWNDDHMIARWTVNLESQWCQSLDCHSGFSVNVDWSGQLYCSNIELQSLWSPKSFKNRNFHSCNSFIIYGSGSQTVCHGILMCRKSFSGVLQNFSKIEIFLNLFTNFPLCANVWEALFYGLTPNTEHLSRQCHELTPKLRNREFLKIYL